MDEDIWRSLHKIAGWQVGDYCRLRPDTYQTGKEEPGIFDTIFQIYHMYSPGELLPTNSMLAVLRPIKGPYTHQTHDIVEDLEYVPPCILEDL